MLHIYNSLQLFILLQIKLEFSGETYNWMFFLILGSKAGSESITQKLLFSVIFQQNNW